MPPTKYINIVFQGGGVRGIAYAGALETKPPHIRLHAVAGTSAGSIVAGLLAIGKTPAEIKVILSDKQLRELVEEAQLKRTERIRNAWKDLRGVWKIDKNGQIAISYRKAFSFARSHKHVFTDLKLIWDNKGFHSSGKLRRFLDNIFEHKKFEHITVDDLKIVAANVNKREYEIYSKTQNLTTPIADAVHASVSIPLFFEPFLVGPQFFVDGGVLSNFPSFLFAQGFYPTIGFRLVDVVPPKYVDSTQSFLQSLLLTMTDAHDKQRGNPPYFHKYEINTPSHIPSTKFQLTEEDVNELYQQGLEVGKQVDWESHASSKRTVPYYDPKPDETLYFSLEQAHRLFSEYSRHGVDSLLHKLTYSVYIEPDWSTRYVSRSHLTVSGARQLMLTRMVWYGEPGTDKPISLVDLNIEAKEIEAGVERNLIRIPAYNSERERGYLLFYSPPVSSQSPREFLHVFEVNQEFSKTIEKGKEDFVEYSCQKLADNHQLELRFEVLVNVDLPPLKLEPEFGMVSVDSTPVTDSQTKLTYKKYFLDVPRTQITGMSKFKMRITRE